MQAGLQAVQPTHKMPTAAKPHRVAPDALDLLEQFGSVVTVHRSCEIYGQGEPAEYCWRILSGCVRTVKLPPRCLAWAVTIAPACRPMFFGSVERCFSVPA